MKTGKKEKGKEGQLTLTATWGALQKPSTVEAS